MAVLKKAAAVMLAICMAAGTVISCCRVQEVRAETISSNEEYRYVISDDGTIRITYYLGNETEISIPEEIDNKRVTVIGEYRTIVFPPEKGLTQITIPDSVSVIETGAFWECENLAAVNAVSNKVFSAKDGVLYSKNETELVCCPPGKTGTYEILQNVTSIKEGAFHGCKGLTQITIPSSVASIGDSAFYACKSLEQITIPDGAAEIPDSSFSGCTNLASVTIPATVLYIKDMAFSNCACLRDVYYAGTQKQWERINISYPYNSDLLNAVIHCSDGIISNGSEQDYEYHELDDGTIEITKYSGSDTIVEVPSQIDGKQVTSIGSRAFYQCTKITQLTLPEGIAKIGDAAFWACSGLAELTLPDSVKDIGDSAFDECRGLTKLSLPASMDSIGRQAFEDCTGLTELAIPNGIEVLNTLLFAGCTGLEEVSIPDTVKKLDAHIFTKCISLKDIYYDGTISQWEQIEIDAWNEEALSEITVHYRGDDSRELYDYEIQDDGTAVITKYNGTEAEAVIPAELDGKRVTKLASGIFKDCDSVEQAAIPASVSDLQEDTFDDCPGLTAIHAENDSESYASEDGVLFNKAKTELIRCPMGKGGKYTVPAGVVSIGNCAFEECSKLAAVILPDGVVRIGNNAFFGCTAATDIVLPESVTEMGNNAFFGCESLKKVNIPGGLKELGLCVFLGCSSLTEAEIPEGVTLINASAFLHCEKLKSIIIPASVITISSVAFDGPETSSLEDVYYGGTREQWEQIEVPGWDEGSVSEKLRLNATIHFKDSPIVLPEEPVQPEVQNPKDELERLKSADPFLLEKDFSHYLSAEQMEILESYLFTWLAEVNYAYQYSGSSDVKELVMKKAGIDPQGDFASGMEQAITHVSVKTPFGIKTFEITMGLGKPDGSGNLYPGYSVMHYEVLEKGGIPSGVPKSGQIVRNCYTDMGLFVQSVKKAAEDSLHGTYQWKSLEDAVTAGILVDKNVSEIVGNRNGSFSDGTYTVFAEPLFAYSKIVHIACPVDVHVYSMDGKEAGSIVNNKPSGGSQNVRLDADGDTKTVYLAGDDYYLNLRGTGNGTMNYQVEEIANEDVQRTVQFLELQLKKDMLYEGYVFRPLNIERDMYALRTKGSSGQEVIYPDSDTYKASFKKVQQLSLSQKNMSLESDRTVQLSASHLPMDASNPNLRWMTDNESVARVDENGLVTAVGSGRATVTVSTKDGSFLKQFCVIDVAGGSDNEDSDSTGGSGNGSGGNGYGGTGSSGSSSSSSGGSGGSGSSSSGGAGTSVGTPQKPSVVKVHYVLQFDLNGGTKTSRRTMTLLSGDIPGIMPKAQRKDYTFSGWFTQKQGGEKVSGSKPLDAAVTLYARWAKTSAPEKPALLTLASKKKGQIQAEFQKADGAAGYQISYSANKNFASAKTKEAKASAKSKAITGLKTGKKYYVRVRAYSLDSAGNRIYGAYSTVKSIMVKS